MLDLVRMMAEETQLPIIAFPTPGLPQLVKGKITYDTSPEYFAKATARLIEEGAKVVGGCCGTTPAHIREMRKMIDAGIKPKARTIITRTAQEKEELPTADQSTLSDKIKKHFVTAVEMDVPRGLRIEKLLKGASMLKDAGCDVINISDGARARLRMNPTAVSNLIQNQCGIEVTMHFSCRDRNLLAIQSDLLGAHALGLRNILAVTGDPANIGDYPSATSVFDVDAIGMCRIMSRFNEGLDLAGYSVGMRTAFTICCAYNPDAIDQELEDERLIRKVDAGAQVVYTQPVFDLATATRAVEVCAKAGVPIMVGVLPLRSARHAEFMHNEVPGVSIPDHLRKMIADAPDDQTALHIGIEQAKSLSFEISKMAQGLYLMPPFGNASIAASVMEVVRS
jgi:methionine synthase / methylenetetrahydrofolate reductase(NADPH)